jgi:nicotinamide-nucleotide amidase
MSHLKRIQKIEIIHLGDELLFGLRPNTHLEYLGRQFSKYGTTIVRDQVIRDNHDEILDCLRYTWGNAELVITTGGLGPTVDDITRQAVAEYFGEELIYNDDTRKHIESRFSSFGKPVTENNLRQCYQLPGSEILENPNGTAPGLWFERDEKLLIMLPGPPLELIPMVENQLIPRLIARGLLQEMEPYVQIRTCGVGESALETMLQPIIASNPGIEAAYCVHSGVTDVRFSSSQPNGFGLAQQTAEQARLLLGEDFVGYGDFDIAKSIVKYLIENNEKISVAESCTGGLISSALVEIPGASKAFSGGVVTYTDEAKIQSLDLPEALIQQHDAVSAETAVAMATGVAEKFSTAYGLSTTGYAGPDGGTAKDPVGTIYIGYHSPLGAWSKRLVFKGDRQTIRQRATLFALDFVRRKQEQSRLKNKFNHHG